jgi:enolase-phosphatase E1
MDIEGTTTSISFVHDILFPYSKENLKSFILRNIKNPEVINCLTLTKKTALEENQKNLCEIEAQDLLLQWIKEDRKHPALKTLQGLIWEEGYLKGEIKGHVYTDVPNALKNWKAKGIVLGVYSSGSVKAQHLIFEYSIEGNLRNFFSNHFDTEIGGKREHDSYVLIAKKLNVPTNEILFLSDIKEELDAAKQAGMQTIQLVRLKNVVTGEHETIENFSQIKF